MISGGDGILTFSIRKMRGMKAIQEVNGTPRWITEYIAEETGILNGPLFHIFVIWTTLYVCMRALPFGQLFPLLLTKTTTMFTVLCRHAHSD